MRVGRYNNIFSNNKMFSYFRPNHQLLQLNILSYVLSLKKGLDRAPDELFRKTYCSLKVFFNIIFFTSHISFIFFFLTSVADPKHSYRVHRHIFHSSFQTGSYSFLCWSVYWSNPLPWSNRLPVPGLHHRRRIPRWS